MQRVMRRAQRRAGRIAANENRMNEEHVLLSRAAEPIPFAEAMRGKQAAARKNQRVKLIVMTFVVMGVVGYLIYSGVRETTAYYVTVGELLQQNAPLPQARVRLGGIVLAGSAQWSPNGGKLNFVIKDEQAAAAVPVEYRGIVPDTFEAGKKILIEGMYANGVFTASQIMPTCPSKYE